MSSVKGRGWTRWLGRSFSATVAQGSLANSKEQVSVKRDTSCLTFNTDLFSNQHLLFPQSSLFPLSFQIWKCLLYLKFKTKSSLDLMTLLCRLLLHKTKLIHMCVIFPYHHWLLAVLFQIPTSYCNCVLKSHYLPPRQTQHLSISSQLLKLGSAFWKLCIYLDFAPPWHFPTLTTPYCLRLLLVSLLDIRVIATKMIMLQELEL